MAENSRGGYEVHHPVDLLRVVFQEGGQHVGFESLSTEPRNSGFKDVARFESGLSDTPALGRLERRIERPRSSIMLVVEAVRP